LQRWKEDIASFLSIERSSPNSAGAPSCETSTIFGLPPRVLPWQILIDSLKYFHGSFTRAASIVGAPKSTFLQSGAHTPFEITIRQTGILDEKGDIEIEMFERFCKFVFEIPRENFPKFRSDVSLFRTGYGRRTEETWNPVSYSPLYLLSLLVAKR